MDEQNTNQDNQPQGETMKHATVLQPSAGFVPPPPSTPSAAPNPEPEPAAPQQPEPFTPPPAPITESQPLPAAPTPDPTPQAAPAPQPLYPTVSHNTLSATSPKWADEPSEEGGNKKFGMISLGIAGTAILLYLLLIFVDSLVKSTTLVYVWFFVFVALGAGGLSLGLLSQKNKSKIDLMGLMAIIVSTVILLVSILVGAYYIRLQIELNKFKNSYNSSTSSFDDSSIQSN